MGGNGLVRRPRDIAAFIVFADPTQPWTKAFPERMAMELRSSYLFSSLTGRKKKIPQASKDIWPWLVLAHSAVLQRVGWGNYTEWRPTGKMSHFPLGAHIVSCWEWEMPWRGRGGEWGAAAHSSGGPSVQDNEACVHKTLSNIPTGCGECGAVNRID